MINMLIPSWRAMAVAATAIASLPTVSEAETLFGLLGGGDGAAIVFNDDHFVGTSGYYGSMYVSHAGDPTDDYDNSPRASGAATKVTHSGSSLKIVRQANGYLDFAPHNLALRSNDVGNASWSKVGTCTATGTDVLNFPASGDRVQQFGTAANCIGRTLIFSAVLSGTPGETMSLTIFENSPLTRQQVTLTATPTRYFVSRDIADTATDVRFWIERTAAIDTATSVTVTDIQVEATYHRTTPGAFIGTTSAAVFDLPFEWDASNNLIGVRMEEARTNLCLRNCDLTDAAWTKTNMTTARTATGPNNRANFATLCTATAANATALQSITSASALRQTGVWLRRDTGTGDIEITQDNGTTWTTVAISGTWAFYTLPKATLANPVVGLRIVTSGDAVEVAFFQHETNANLDIVSSPIYTVGASVTRAADNFSVVVASLPTIGAEATLYSYFKPAAIDHTIARASASLGATTTNHIWTGTRSAFNNLRGAVTSGGVNSMIVEAGTASLSGNKIAVAVALNDGEVVMDGTSVGTDASTGIPSTAPTALWFHGPAASTNSNGHLVAIAMTNSRMSQADMITLTS